MHFVKTHKLENFPCRQKKIINCFKGNGKTFIFIWGFIFQPYRKGGIYFVRLRLSSFTYIQLAWVGRVHEGCRQVSQIFLKRLKRIPSITPNPQLWPTFLLRAGLVPLERLQLFLATLPTFRKLSGRETDTPQNPRKWPLFSKQFYRNVPRVHGQHKCMNRKKKKNHMYSNF